VVLGERQRAAAAELGQWWEAVRSGGVGSQAVLLAAPSGWGRSTVLDRLPGIWTRPDDGAALVVRLSGGSLPEAPGPQAAALRDGLLGPSVRRQAAGLLCRSRLRGAARMGQGSLLQFGLAGTFSLLLAGLAAAAGGGTADSGPASADGAAARAARVVAAVSASAPVVVIIDDADRLEPGVAVAMIENLIEHHDGRVLVVAAVEPGSDVAAALTARARYGPTAGRVHRADADPRMGWQSRAELAGELSPHLTAAQARQLARDTATFAEVFAAARPRPPSRQARPGTIQDVPGAS
jgi:hypothetical protein